MAASFAITSLPSGTSAPADCAIQSIETKESVDKSTYRDGTGTTVGAIPHRLKTTEVSLEFKGKVPLAGVTPGAFTEGTLKLMSAKFSETVDDVPSGTLAYKAYGSN